MSCDEYRVLFPAIAISLITISYQRMQEFKFNDDHDRLRRLRELDYCGILHKFEVNQWLCGNLRDLFLKHGTLGDFGKQNAPCGRGAQLIDSPAPMSHNPTLGNVQQRGQYIAY